MGAVGTPRVINEMTFRADQSNLTLTALPAAFDYLDTSARSVVGPYDLTGLSQCQLITRKQTVAGSASAVLVLAFSLVNPGAAVNLPDWTQSLATNSLVPTNANVASGFVPIPAAFLGNAAVYMQVLQGGGDGVASPVVGFVKGYLR